MKREEFIDWMDNTSCYEKDGTDSWKELVDYANYRWDYIDLEGDKVVYSWEELYWGGSNWEKREFAFEEFIEAYNSDSIKW